MRRVLIAAALFAGTAGAAWALPEGAELLVGEEASRSVTTQAKYGDVQVHLEWKEPSYAKSQNHGYTRGRARLSFGDFCSIALHDSFGADASVRPIPNPTAPDQIAGAVVSEHAPLVNASRTWEKWQSFDIVFRQPRWEGTNLVFKGEITVFLNGVLVQDKWCPQGGMSGRSRAVLRPPRSPKMKIVYSHMTPTVKIRNFWVKEIPAKEPENGGKGK